MSVRRCAWLVILAAACDGAKPAPPPTREPDHVRVQHVLVGFHGSAGSTRATRTREEAESLARQLFEQANAGADFAALMRNYSDDPGGGDYRMANHGVVTRSPEERPRDGMVRGFGDTAFRLAVGEVGLAEYDAERSPFGWHILKRVE